MNGSLRKFRNMLGRGRGYGGCYRCGDTYNWAAFHSTEYELGAGCFPLCEECWATLSPSQRLPYYDAVVNEWIRQDPSGAVEYDRKRDLIRKAVMADG